MKNGSILMGTKVGASLIGKANKLKRLGKLEEAVEAYLQVVEVNPSFAWGYYYLGELEGCCYGGIWKSTKIFGNCLLGRS